MQNKITAALLGVAVGDALGVPVEFEEREYLTRFPVVDMQAFGTHHQPAGTFSDDASLTFCLAEALVNGCDPDEIADNFKLWLYQGFWSARGQVFDIGIATHQAIERLARGIKPEVAGGFEVSSNGNGSLMRILPLVFYIKDKPVEERYAITKMVSSITHGHVRSVIACFYYLEFARHLLETTDIHYIYTLLKTEVGDFLKAKGIIADEVAIFDRLLKGDIYTLPEDEVQSSGYVLHTLEASIWCLFTTDNYKDATLKAVNLGSDTDTTAAVTGGLAALLYGYETIPQDWLNVLAKRQDIEKLAVRLDKGLQIQNADFIAELTYKTTEQGGRKTPAASGYRPQIKFSFDKMSTSGTQIFIDKEFVYPGETVEAAIRILSPEFFNGRLYDGLDFEFMEGDKVLGKGTITNILNPDLKTKI
ncbi:ADP-ribosylglycohydrolase family protein [Flavobacterium akiainvivens]|uniref:ADP-ribosylglycohydrolase family protein n=1 Tax=Flavobacterium akiainvivens TaxID=1202724 RepID=UPI0008E6A919|nr:ADP-ribosylglycohydrolase family protein [Flavobacterium akiainvivens]SFQ41992.1 ADP-ribosylglycohydrolase [Flavobacterium akiainvivens]